MATNSNGVLAKIGVSVASAMLAAVSLGLISMHATVNVQGSTLDQHERRITGSEDRHAVIERCLGEMRERQAEQTALLRQLLKQNEVR